MLKLQWTSDEKKKKKLVTFPAWQLEKNNSKKEIVLGTQRDKSPLCCINGHVPPQSEGLKPKLQKYLSRVVLRGDTAKKKKSGVYEIFTEQGSSVSQMTVAKVMHVIARVPDSDGEAADAISVYTQEKMETFQN